MLETSDNAVWATSLVEHKGGELRSALSFGTAGFEVRVEGGSIVIRTDPLGTCPIWYARAGDAWVVSPEAKAIAAIQPVRLLPDDELLKQGEREADWSPFRNALRLAPGSELRLAEGGAVSTADSPMRFELADGGDRETRSAEDWTRELGEVLISSYESANVSTGAFVSGGIDSSIACSLARRDGEVFSYSLGTRHGDEFVPARALADELGCEHKEIHLDHEGVRDEFERVVFQNEIFDGLTAEIVCQLSALYGAAGSDCQRIATGYGSDLLFDGMLRHALYMTAVELQTTPQLIERTRWTGELAPFVNWSRGLAAEHVFWKPEVIELALRVPRELCFVDGVEKHVLRSAAVHGKLLPERLAFRKKVGMTNGTGANKLLSEALGIDDSNGYLEKSERCLELLKRIF